MPFCPHCNRNTFEILAVDVGGTKYNCVQCSGCKAPVSFVERSRVEESDETRVTEVLRVVVSSLQTINSRLIRMEQIMQMRQ
jgi:hypothetical protein